MKYLLILLVPCALFAHRLNIVVYDDGDTITLKGYYSAQSVCRNCKVEIQAKDFNKVYKTSEKGLVTLAKKELPKTKMNISINGGDGHFEQMSYKLEQSEEAPTLATDAPDANVNPTTTGNAKAAKNEAAMADMQTSSGDTKASTGGTNSTTGASASSTSGAAVSGAEPKHRAVTRSRPEISAYDIGSALGYVFGVFGIIALILSRRKGGKKGSGCCH